MRKKIEWKLEKKFILFFSVRLLHKIFVYLISSFYFLLFHIQAKPKIKQRIICLIKKGLIIKTNNNDDNTFISKCLLVKYVFEWLVNKYLFRP